MQEAHRKQNPHSLLPVREQMSNTFRVTDWTPRTKWSQPQNLQLASYSVAVGQTWLSTAVLPLIHQLKLALTGMVWYGR